MAENNNQKKSVTVEDLLKLKRDERPDEAFWERFDRELHQKTLRSIVKTEPTPKHFWSTLIRFVPALPLAGAAAFALTFAISNGYLSLPHTDTSAEVNSFIAQPSPIEVAAFEAPVIEQPTGAPSFVVSALPSREAFSEERYTQVPVSRSMSPAHRPDVKFIGGTLAASVPHVGQVAGLY